MLFIDQEANDVISKPEADSKEIKTEMKAQEVAKGEKPQEKAANVKARSEQEEKPNNKTGKKQNIHRANSNQRRGSNDGLIEKLVGIKRISKTTKGGRHMRFSVLMVVGDKKGTVGFGMGKSNEIPTAIKKATKNARNNLAKVLINKDGTLFHDVVGKSCAGKVLLKPAKKGTGLIAGGAIRAVVELAGYKDIYTNNMGENTPVNMIRAAINGLKMQKTPKQVAFLRDKKINEL